MDQRTKKIIIGSVLVGGIVIGGGIGLVATAT